ncbi:hypothetical protein V2O64_23200 [Verrucomicrobiaceae bacterium 227]
MPRFKKPSNPYNLEPTVPLKTQPSTGNSPQFNQNPRVSCHYGHIAVRDWPSRDPIGERGGVNLYGMVGSNLVIWIDYLGLLDINLNKACRCKDGRINKELWTDFADNVEDKEEWLTLMGHGSPNSIQEDTKEGSGTYSGYGGAAEIAQMIKDHPDFRAGKIKRVILYSCDAGHGVNSIAQKISLEVPGVIVQAASKSILCEKSGDYDIFGRTYGKKNPKDLGEWRYFKDGYVMSEKDGGFTEVKGSYYPKPEDRPRAPKLPEGYSLAGRSNGEKLFQGPDGDDVT